MKVLLLGEFSALHKYLKEGLEEIGVDVRLLANGDSWKKIDGADGFLYRTGGNILQRSYRIGIEPLKRMDVFSGYDVVQFINTICFYPTINPYMVSEIKKRNHVLSLVAAGYDSRLYEKYMTGFFDYYMMDNADSILRSFDRKTLKGNIHQWNDHKVEKYVDVIIPSAYEYRVGYAESGKASIVVPFPINVKNIEYSENETKNRIVFFHGLNRETEKGTSYIRKALDKLKNNYPNDVEVIIDGHMPFKRYQEVLKKSNVVIDQCKSYGYGINACISMAEGKIVLSGRHQEHLDSMGVDKCPIIEIKPDVEQIYSQLLLILENRTRIPQLGRESREYVEKYHDHIKVANIYYHIWEELLKKKEVVKNDHAK